MNYVEWVKQAIEKKSSKLNSEALLVEGMSATKSRHLLNNICAFPEVVYLEIGSWKGSTIIASSFGNRGKFYAIDNFSKWFKKSESPAKDFYANKEKFKKHCNYEFFESDSWEFDKFKIKGKVNVYFYDGDHTPEGTKKAFTYYNDVLDDVFIMIMDDWNRGHIRTSTNDAIKGYTVLYEKEFFTPDKKNDPHGSQGLGSVRGRARDTWWNGLYVAVIKNHSKS